jgi:hypothetical protein
MKKLTKQMITFDEKGKTKKGKRILPKTCCKRRKEKVEEPMKNKF